MELMDNLHVKLRKAYYLLTMFVDSHTRETLSLENFVLVGEIRMLLDHAADSSDENRIFECIHAAVRMIQNQVGCFQCCHDFNRSIANRNTFEEKILAEACLIECFATELRSRGFTNND